MFDVEVTADGGTKDKVSIAVTIIEAPIITFKDKLAINEAYYFNETANKLNHQSNNSLTYTDNIIT